MRVLPSFHLGSAPSLILTWALAGAFIGAGCNSELTGTVADGWGRPDTSDTSSDGTSPDDGSDTTTPPDGDATTPPDGDATTSPDADATTPAPTLVKIVAPVDWSTVSGTIPVRLVPVDRTERNVDYVTLSINGREIYRDVKLPTEIMLDTREHTAPELELEAYAKDGFQQGSHKVTIRANNPPIRFVEVTPREPVVRDDDIISVEVRLAGPPELQLSADFSAIDSGYQVGMERAYPLGANKYALTYTLSAGNERRDGTYIVPIKAKVSTWEVVYTQLTITLRNGGTSPVIVPGGIFVDTLLPAATAVNPDPAPVVATSSPTILTGGTSTLAVSWAGLPNTGDIIGLMVGVDGLSGYYQIPIDPSSGVTSTEVKLQLRRYEDGETAPTSLPIRLALRDLRGRVSTYYSRALPVTKVGSGDIQVSVSWDTATDVDLYVVDPFGCELYYGNRSDSGSGSVCRGAGGELDLDSNAGCGGRDLRNENVFWPPAASPLGDYTVRLNYWSACSNSGTTNYVVTVNYCGRTELFEGSFTQSNATGGGSGAGKVITRFNNTACSRTAIGQIRYQDMPLNRFGFGGGQWRSLEGAVVEIRELERNEVVGTGVTDRDGNYAVPFSKDVNGYTIAVKAMSDPSEGVRDIKVYNHPKFKKLYEITSAPVIVQRNAIVIRQDLDISTEMGSGAFNIFDTLRQGYDLIRLANGRVLGELRAFWATGTDTTDTFYCSDALYEQGLCTEVRSVSVQGKDTDRDEFDDMVILKEFFKFALSIAARDSHPGDYVTGRRDDARRVWTEGAAHFFAGDVVGSRYFVNSRPYGVYVVDDLEGMSSPYAFTVTEDGKLSHYLVAAALWDLADSSNEAWDDVDRMRNAVYDAIFSYLPSTWYQDRGAVGVDFTDFLDGWFCRGWGDRDNVQALIEDYYQYPYDFDGPLDCTAL